jgi:hypothetical protein
MDEPHAGRDEILAIARLAGLHLTAAYEAELLEAYEHVRRLVALIPRPHARGDEPAHVFDPVKLGPMPG